MKDVILAVIAITNLFILATLQDIAARLSEIAAMTSSTASQMNQILQVLGNKDIGLSIGMILPWLQKISDQLAK